MNLLASHALTKGLIRINLDLSSHLSFKFSGRVKVMSKRTSFIMSHTCRQAKKEKKKETRRWRNVINAFFYVVSTEYKTQVGISKTIGSDIVHLQK